MNSPLSVAIYTQIYSNIFSHQFGFIFLQYNCKQSKQAIRPDTFLEIWTDDSLIQSYYRCWELYLEGHNKMLDSLFLCSVIHVQVRYPNKSNFDKVELVN